MKNMKRLSCLFLLMVFLFVLISCQTKGNNSEAKEVPIYQGMTISSLNQKKASQKLLAEIDQEDPFDNFDGETIIDEADDVFGVISSENIDYYINLNEDFLITIKLHNPSNHIILSFILNGVFYQSYQFQEGSDSENIILKTNSGSISGIKEYTIDAIKYVEGSEIKDAIIGGDQTVKVGVTYENIPFANLVDHEVTSTSVTFKAQVSDPIDLIATSGNHLKVVLYDGENIIRQKDISLGTTEVLFDNLEPGKIYQYGIVTAYDSLDGQGIRSILLESYAFSTIDIFSVYIDKITQTSMTFSLSEYDPTNVGDFSSIKLLKDNQVVKELSKLDEFIFNNLLSNTKYELLVTYDYSSNQHADEKPTSLIKKLTFRTKEKVLPKVSIYNVIAGQEKVDFEIEIIDQDQVGIIQKIELMDGAKVVDTLEPTSKAMFENLYSNYNYTIKVTYTYDLNDAKGLQTKQIESAFKTQSKQSPKGQITNLIETQTTFSFDLELIDVDNIAYIKSINVFKDKVLVKEITDFSLREVRDLQSGTYYTLEVIYGYNLNDSNGEKLLTLQKEVYTKPYLELLSSKVINTNKLTSGDVLVMEFTIYNPADILVKNVVINDKIYQVMPISTSTYLRVEINIDDTYRGGINEFEITKIQGYKNNDLISFDIKDNNIASGFVNGPIDVLEMFITDANNEKIDFAMIGQSYYVNILLDNPTQYDIDELVLSRSGGYYWGQDWILNKTEYEINEDNSLIKILVQNTVSNTTLRYELKTFNYWIDNSTESQADIQIKEKQVINQYTSVILVNSTQYIDIRTASELSNIQNGYAYRLVNDIDMTNVVWSPKSISYVILDGNGFTIHGFRNVATYENTTLTYGLFEVIDQSTIINLTISDALIISTINSTVGNNFNAYVGFLAGQISNSTIKNISLNGEISVSNKSSQYSYNTFVGALSGYIYGSSIEYVYSNVIISSNGILGGISGISYTSLYKGLYSEGQIVIGEYTDNYIGGLFGQAQSNNQITDSYSKMTITSSNNTNYGSYIGGLFGNLDSSLVSNSYFNGFIQSNQDSYYINFIGAMNNSKLTNVFAISDQNFNMTNQSNSQFNNVYTTNSNDSFIPYISKEVVMEKMMSLFNPAMWSYKNELPQLKWKPSIKIINATSKENSITFNLLVLDLENITNIISIHLYKGGEFIKSIEDLGDLKFENLQYNMNYTIKVTYAYDYGDTLGEQIVVVSHDIKTQPVVGSPEISLENVLISDTKVSFEVKEKISEIKGNIVEVKLYSATHDLLQTLNLFEILEFNSLTSNTTYIIEVIYEFDMNDGLGIQSISEIITFTTLPQFEVVDMEISNTEAIFTGDTIVLIITINNPNEINFTHVTINGTKYTIRIFAADRLVVYIPVDKSFGINNQTLVLESMVGIFDSVTKNYDVLPIGSKSIDVLILGEIDLIDFTIKDKNNQKVDVINYMDEIIMEYRFFNPSRYHINSISVTGVGMINILDDMVIQDGEYTTIKYRMKNYNSGYTALYNVDYFTYTNQILNENLIKNKYNIKINIATIPNVKPQYIYSSADLINMNNTGYYVLMNDIDLRGVNWIPKVFNGFLDGNNHKISNLSIIKTYEYNNTSVNQIGLFSNLNYASIINLSLENFSFIININVMDYLYLENYIGGLAGSIHNSYINNIHIDSDIFAETNGYNHYLNVGNLFGEVINSSISEVTIKGYLDGNGYFGSIATIINQSKIENILIQNEVGSNVYSFGAVAMQLNVVDINYAYVMSTIQSSGYGFSQSNNNTNVYNSIFLSKNKVNQSSVYPGEISGDYQNNFTNYSSGKGYIQLSEEAINQWVNQNYDLTIWSFDQNNPKINIKPIVRLSVDEVTEYGLTYTIDVKDDNENVNIIAIEIYNEDQFVMSLDDLSIRDIDSLRYSTTYEIRVIYSYTVNGENVEEIISKTFTTIDKENIPQVEITEIVVTSDSIEFNISVLDVEEVSNFVKVELYQLIAERKIFLREITDFNNLKFDDLYSSYAYMIKVIYSYDFNDGFGESYVEDEYSFVTPSLNTPHVTTSITTNQSEVNYQVIVHNDVDQVFNLIKVELYDGTTLVETLYTINGSFNDLESYKYYQLKVYYELDLNLSTGIVSSIIQQQTRTSPKLDVTKFEIFNTTELFVGNTVIFKLEFDNPSNMSITNVSIDGVIYPVTNMTNYYLVYVTLTNDYIGGLTNFNINYVQGTINNEIFNVKQSNTLEAFVNGEVDFIDVDITDLNGNVLKYVSYYSKYRVSLRFYNPSDYEIRSVITSYYSIKITPEMVTREGLYTIVTFDKNYELSSSTNLRITGFNYYNARTKVTYEKSVSNYSGIYPLTYNNFDESINKIYTAEDLMNMETYGRYELMSDIDLENIQWKPLNFNGYLNGNNFVIRGLNIVNSYQDNVSNYVGLFGKLNNASIENLIIEDANFILAISEGGTNNYQYIGLFSGLIENTTIRNVVVKGDISLNVLATNYTDIYHALFVGRINSSTIENITVEGMINSNAYRSSGIASRIDYAKMKNIIVDANGVNYIYSHDVNYSNISNIVARSNMIEIPVISNSYLSAISNIYILFDGYLYHNSSNTYKNIYTYYNSSYNTNYTFKTKQQIIELIKNDFDSKNWVTTSDLPVLKSKPTIQIEINEIGNYDVSFDTYVSDYNDVLTINGYEILYEGSVIASSKDLDLFYFDGLRYSTNYVLRIKYTYNYNDGTEIIHGYIDVNFYTLDKENIPVISIKYVYASSDDVQFKIEVDDILNIGYIREVQLLDGQNIIKKLEDINELKFEDLLSNHDYIIKVIYDYDFNDGWGSSYVSNTYTFRTSSKEIPTLKYITSSSSNTISYQIIANDIEELLIVENVELHKGDELIHSSKELKYTFDNLDSISDYKLVVNYKYDLNDGFGYIKKVYTENIQTSPTIDVTGIEILNTDSVMIGDMLSIRINVELLESMEIIGAYINGIYYPVTSSYEGYIILNIELQDVFHSGLIIFELNSLETKYANDLYNISILENNIVEKYINNQLEILNMQFVDLDGNEIEYIQTYQTFYMDIQLNNIAGYEIKELGLSTSNYYYTYTFESINRDLIRVKYQEVNGYLTKIHVTLNYIIYSSDDIGIKTIYTSLKDSIITLSDTNPISISTPADLDNISNGYLYNIVNDIDLNGISWTQKNYNNIVILGNGYSIKNLSLVKTYENTDINLGLFNQLSYSYIKDLDIKNFFFNITHRTNNQTDLNVKMGFLASGISYSTLKGINLEGNIIFDSKVTKGNNYIGGIAGYIYESNLEIIDIKVNATNKSENNTSYFAAGYSDFSIFNNIRAKTYYLGNLNVGIYGISNNGLTNSSLVISNVIIYPYGNNQNTYYFDTISNSPYKYNIYSGNYEEISYSLWMNDLNSAFDHSVWDFDNLDNLGLPNLKQ